MITSDQRLEAAQRAATAAQFAIEPKGRNWCEVLKMKPDAMAVFVAANPTAPAEALYLSSKPKKPWVEAGAPLRVALETFRATYLALVALLEAEPEKPVPMTNQRRFGARTFEKVPGLRDRNTFRKRT
jgi:hypothetical protein